jgi:hypothetical protein
MTITIDASYINQFSDNIHSLLEQESSKVRGIFMEEEKAGEKHFFERLGSFTAKEVIGRLSTTDLQDPAHTRRMATVRLYEASTYLDDIDKIKMLIDPTSEYAKKLARAHGRNFDDVVIEAIKGTANTGKDGSGTQSLPSAQKIAHGSAGLTVAKLNQALRIFEADEIDVDGTELFLLVGALGVEDLYGDSTNQLTSFDFQEGKPISSGSLPKFRGVNIVRTQRIPHITADTTYRALLVTKEAVKVAVAKQLEVKTAERADLNFAAQISTYMALGAVRMEDKQVVEIAFQ